MVWKERKSKNKKKSSRIDSEDPLPRVPVSFQGKKGQIVLDQIRTIDKTRLTRKLGRIHKRTAQKVLDVLQEMFAP